MISSTMRPSARNSTRSAYAAAAGSWVTMTIVWPISRTESLQERRGPRRRTASRGCRSARRRRRSRGGWPGHGRTATRCCWPPESSLGRWCSRSRRPTVSITVSSHSWSGLRPAMSIGSVMFSIALRVGTRLNAWKMKPRLSRRSRVSRLSSRADRSTSPMNTEPEVAVSSPAMQCISVDLPDPDGPMIAVNWPRSNAHDTASSATTRVSPCAVDLGQVDGPRGGSGVDGVEAGAAGLVTEDSSSGACGPTV